MVGKSRWGHTQDMAIDEIEWNTNVERAMIAGDSEALLRLYAEGEKLFGGDRGVRWAAAISGFDASAVTG